MGARRSDECRCALRAATPQQAPPRCAAGDDKYLSVLPNSIAHKQRFIFHAPQCRPADPAATPTRPPSTCLQEKRHQAPLNPRSAQPPRKPHRRSICLPARKSAAPISPISSSSSSSSSGLPHPMFGRPTKARIAATCFLSAHPHLCPKHLADAPLSPSETPTCTSDRVLKLRTSPPTQLAGLTIALLRTRIAPPFSRARTTLRTRSRPTATSSSAF